MALCNSKMFGSFVLFFFVGIRVIKGRAYGCKGGKCYKGIFAFWFELKAFCEGTVLSPDCSTQEATKCVFLLENGNISAKNTTLKLLYDYVISIFPLHSLLLTQ